MNARLRLLTILSLTVLASACGKDDDKKTASPVAAIPAPEVGFSPQTVPESESASEAIPAIIAFDINAVPVTDKDIGEFPFFMPPNGYRYVSDTLSVLDENISIKESSRSLYPIGSDRIYMVEGKTLKALLYNEKLKGISERDFLLIQRHYEDAITAAGGIKVFDEKVKIDETYGTLGPEEHRLIPGSTRSVRQTYVIRTQNTEAWFEINCGGGASCLFNVTQKGKM